MEEICKIEEQMAQALEKGDAEQFSRLERKRSKIMRELCVSTNVRKLSQRAINDLIDSNKKLLASGRKHLGRMQKEVDRLQSLKNASKQVTQAYNKPAGAGRFIAGRG